MGIVVFLKKYIHRGKIYRLRNGGLDIFDLQGKLLDAVSVDGLIIPNTPVRIFIDRANNIWFGGDQHIYYMSVQEQFLSNT